MFGVILDWIIIIILIFKKLMTRYVKILKYLNKCVYIYLNSSVKQKYIFIIRSILVLVWDRKIYFYNKIHISFSVGLFLSHTFTWDQLFQVNGIIWWGPQKLIQSLAYFKQGIKTNFSPIQSNPHLSTGFWERENFKIKSFVMLLNNLYPKWCAPYIFTLCLQCKFWSIN